VGMALALLFAACTHHGASTSRPPPTLSPTPVSAGPATTVATMPGPPTFQVVDLWFVGGGHGWVLGLECPSPGVCRAGIRATDDGGRTWRKTGAPPVGISTAEGGSSVSQIRFADRLNGFVFGPRLFVTHDGARSWAEGNVAGRVRALEAVGTSVWALREESCSSGVCPEQLVVSSDFGRTWDRAPVQPPVAGTPGTLLRFGQSTAWLLSWNYGREGSSGGLIITRDRGRSWHELPNPCTPEYASDERLATSDGVHVWLLCAGQPSAGQQLKVLHGSADGGAHWDAGRAAPSGGYVWNLAVGGLEREWLSLQRGTLQVTVDGGATWQAGIPYDVANAEDTGVGPVRFWDLSHGWVAGSSSVFRTVDGGAHWDGVRLPV
jgi:photosystem II stability/assembly factor-like uncharacterized protein